MYPSSSFISSAINIFTLQSPDPTLDWGGKYGTDSYKTPLEKTLIYQYGRELSEVAIIVIVIMFCFVYNYIADISVPL